MLDPRLLTRSAVVSRAFAPFAKRHKRQFVFGCGAAVGVVAARLALPWPLRAISDPMGSGTSGPNGFLGWLAADATHVAIAAGAAFVTIIFVLGLADSVERVRFAAFATGTVRDLRAAAFRSAVGGAGARATDADAENWPLDDGLLSGGQGIQEARARADCAGDLATRIVGDAERVKAGMQSFLVHVMTSGLVFLGVSIILFAMNWRFGCIFALSGLGIALVTYWSASRMFQRSLVGRAVEGRLAEEVHKALRGETKREGFVRLNKSSAEYKVTQKRIEGTATWSAHVLFGLAVLAALFVGADALQSGHLVLGDILVLMMYALVLRGPVVRLARQGCRTGKVLGAAERLVRLLENRPAVAGEIRPTRLPPLCRSLRLNGVTKRFITCSGAAEFGPIDLEIPVGQRVAVIDADGVAKRVLFEIIAGRTVADAGEIRWDDANIGKLSRKKRSRKILYIRQTETMAPSGDSANPTHVLVSSMYRSRSVYLFDEPTRHFARDRAEAWVKALLSKVRRKVVIVGFEQPVAVAAFDRVLHLENGRVVFDGSADEWRRAMNGDAPRSDSSPEAELPASGFMPKPPASPSSGLLVPGL